MNELPFGVDVSKYQGVINFDKLAAATPKVRFMAMRAGISWGYEDPQFVTNMAGAKRIGVPRIAYHVPYFSEDAKKQTDHIMRILDKGGFDPQYDRLCIDAEQNNGMTKAAVTQKTAQILELLKNEYERYPMIYSRASWVDLWLDVGQLPPVDWWLANYLKALPAPQYTPEKSPPPLLPKGVGTWLIHQTGERGNGGKYGMQSYYVDTDRWNGAEEELSAYFGLTEETPEPPPVEIPLFQAKVITIPPNRLKVRKAPNGAERPQADWLTSGQVVDVYEAQDDWYRHGIEKWSSALWLKRLDDTPPVIPPSELPLFEATVTTVPPNRLRVRRTPNGEFVRWLQSGDTVSVYQEQVGWYRIGDGEWASSDYLQRVFYRPDLLNVPLFSQRDPRWANDRMGNSYITLGQEGCLVTCTASLLNFLGIKVDPKTYNALLTARSGYAPPNLMYWKMPDVLWQGEVERAEYSGWFSGGKGWEAFANAILESGRPALAHVDFVPGGAVNQHWVLLIGKVDGVWWCYDPWYGAVAALGARYNGIYRIVSYRRQA